jgi:hypothetical protein
MNKSIGGRRFHNLNTNFDSQGVPYNNEGKGVGYNNGPVQITIATGKRQEVRTGEENKNFGARIKGGINSTEMHQQSQIGSSNLVGDLRQIVEGNIKNEEINTKDKKIIINNKMGKLSATQTDGYGDEQVNGFDKHVDDDEVLDLVKYLGDKKQPVVEEVGLQNNNSSSEGNSEKLLQGFVEGDGQLTDKELKIQDELDGDLVVSSVDNQGKKEGDEIVSVDLESQRPQVDMGEDEWMKSEIEKERIHISEESTVKKGEIVNSTEYKKLKEKLKLAQETLKEKKDLFDRLRFQVERLNDKIGILGKNVGMIDSLQSELQDAEKNVTEAQKEVDIIQDEINALKPEIAMSSKELLNKVVGKRTGQTFIVDIQNVIKKISPDMDQEEAGDVANLVMDGFFAKIKEEFSYEEANKIFALAFRKFNATIGSEFVVKFDEQKGFVLEIPEIDKKLNELIVNVSNNGGNPKNEAAIVGEADDYNVNNLTKAA